MKMNIVEQAVLDSDVAVTFVATFSCLMGKPNSDESIFKTVAHKQRRAPVAGRHTPEADRHIPVAGRWEVQHYHLADTTA